MKASNEKKERDGDQVRSRANLSGRTRASFVMTVWPEPREAEAEPEWRWRVRHVQTGEQAYFRRYADVLAFISSQSGLPAPR